MKSKAVQLISHDMPAFPAPPTYQPQFSPLFPDSPAFCCGAGFLNYEDFQAQALGVGAAVSAVTLLFWLAVVLLVVYTQNIILVGTHCSPRLSGLSSAHRKLECCVAQALQLWDTQHLHVLCCIIFACYPWLCDLDQSLHEQIYCCGLLAEWRSTYFGLLARFACYTLPAADKSITHLQQYW